MYPEKSKCINCSFVNFNDLGQFICTQKNIPVEKEGSCELYQARQVIKTSRKKNKALKIAFAILFFAFIPFVNEIAEINKQNEYEKKLKEQKERLKTLIQFNGFREFENEEKHIEIRAVYYTRDSLCTYERFENEAKKNYHYLPERFDQIDTLHLEHQLIIASPNESFHLSHSISGLSIKQYVNRRFEKAD